jgi:NADPH:quinone reductase-like Zn-dependent oxidoreductase
MTSTTVTTTMRAVTQDRYGDAEVLRVSEVARPAVGDHEVLVRVSAAGLDRGTQHLMTGTPYAVRLALGLRRPRQPIAGRDVAGTVEEVGSAVTRFAVGDEVYGMAGGSFAEYAVAREAKLAPKPTTLSFAQAAVVPISGGTALQALVDAGRVQAGQTVLVIGASGGVGTYAVQLAKAFGAEVTGVCSRSKADLVRSLGAEEVIDYTQENLADGRRRWDVIVDTAGRRPVHLLRRALTPRGTLAIVGGDGGGKVTGGFFRQMLRAPMLALLTSQRLRPVTAKETQEDLRTVAEMIDAGQLMPVVGKTFPLAEAAAAVRELEGGHARGKLVVTVQG